MLRCWLGKEFGEFEETVIVPQADPSNAAGDKDNLCLTNVALQGDGHPSFRGVKALRAGGIC